MHGADLKEEDGETDGRDGVSDRPSLCWVLKPGALRQLRYGWRTTSRSSTGLQEEKRSLIASVLLKIDGAVGYVNTQVVFCCVLLIADGFCKREIKWGFFFLQVMKSENKLQRNFSSACECLRKWLLSLQAPSDISN